MKGARFPSTCPAWLVLGLVLRPASACSFLVANYNLTAYHSARVVAAANWWQQHRGPDAKTVAGAGGWSFVHNLLSMTGKFTLQPFMSEDRSVVALFNGAQTTILLSSCLAA